MSINSDNFIKGSYFSVFRSDNNAVTFSHNRLSANLVLGIVLFSHSSNSMTFKFLTLKSLCNNFYS